MGEQFSQSLARRASGRQNSAPTISRVVAGRGDTDSPGRSSCALARPTLPVLFSLSTFVHAIIVAGESPFQAAPAEQAQESAARLLAENGCWKSGELCVQQPAGRDKIIVVSLLTRVESLAACIDSFESRFEGVRVSSRTTLCRIRKTSAACARRS